MRRLLTIAAGTTLVLGAFACAPQAGLNGQGKVTPPGSLACAPIGGAAHPVVHATDTLRPGQWAFDHYDFEAVWPRTNGAGIKVAVLDSGVDGRVPDLQGQVLPGRSFITTNDAAGVAYDPNPTDPNLGNQDVNPDPNGHGSQVASLIAAKADGQGIVGAAPGVKILPAVVIINDFEGHARREVSTSGADDIANAVYWAVGQHANVINMSFGEVKLWPQDEAAITFAEQQGVVVVAASGNWPVTDPNYPAAFDNVLAVGGMDSNGELDPTSVTGAYVDAVAPGGDVLAALQPWSTVALFTGFGGQLYGRETGTSEAAPYASALAALVRAAHPTWTAPHIRQRIEATALDAGPTGKDQFFGSGLIAPRAAVGC